MVKTWDTLRTYYLPFGIGLVFHSEQRDPEHPRRTRLTNSLWGCFARPRCLVVDYRKEVHCWLITDISSC